MCLGAGRGDRGSRGPSAVSQSKSATYRRVSASPLHGPASRELLELPPRRDKAGGCSGWILVRELGVALLSSGKVEILALSPQETGRVSISNEVGYFDIPPEELYYTGPLFPCRTQALK
ncbi:unnamed protein product [Coccothraustes coccothraustes]